jgi:transcriptional regulator with XRE-family HTH domain
MEKQIQHDNRDEILRELLKNEFQKRAQKNPSFSLRALSQKVGLDQSLLSKILQGKRKFSELNAKKVSNFLGVYLQHQSDSYVAEAVKTNYNLLREDQFLLISAWYHFALLELIKTKNFKNSTVMISQRLGISESDVEMSINRLRRLGFLEENQNKLILKKSSNKWVDLENTNTARKSLQKSLLEKSQEALESVAFDKRIHSSLTIAVDLKLLPEIKNKVEEFKNSLDSFIESHGNEKEVYNLSISFFPLTKNNINNSK